MYDRETQLYYLQSRYYDPQTHRFLNADSFTSTGQGFTGNNMFSYCGNNPVVHADASGKYYLTFGAETYGFTNASLRHYIGSGGSGACTGGVGGGTSIDEDDLSISFGISQQLTMCRYELTASVMKGEIDVLALSNNFKGENDFSLVSAEMACVSIDGKCGFFEFSPVDLCVAELKAGVYDGIPGISAMVTVWNPSVSIDFGVFTLTIAAEIGSYGFTFLPAKGEIGVAAGIGMSISIS